MAQKTKKISKPKIAIVSLTSCAGCIVEIVNLGEQLLHMLEYIEIVDFPLVKERQKSNSYDIAFLEGSPVTKENIQDLEKLRKKSKLLVALGACACIGGIPELKNQTNKDKLIKNIYQSVKKIDNPDIKPLNKYVKIDFEIPGCPPNKNEFAQIVNELLANKIPKIPAWPVCYECQLREYGCLLQQGFPCLGPIVLGGCEAICLKNKQACSGCRGLLPGPPIKNFKKLLKQHGVDKKNLDSILEKFGLKDKFQTLCQK